MKLSNSILAASADKQNKCDNIMSSGYLEVFLDRYIVCHFLLSTFVFDITIKLDVLLTAAVYHIKFEILEFLIQALYDPTASSFDCFSFLC